MIRELNIEATMSVHFEYPLPHDRARAAGAEVRRQTIAVMKRDVDAIKTFLVHAGLN